MNNRSKNWLGGGKHKGQNVNELKLFEKIISLENLFSAWREFKKGKTKKKDVQEFSINLEDNIFILHEELQNGKYRHSNYISFFVKDPKLRHIHKALVRDRLLHHAIIRVIEPIFDKTFIFDSYSSRKNKGTHKAINRFKDFAWKLSRNNTKTVWILKCDIKKYFDSVDHEILLKLIKKKIKDEKLLHLLENIIMSYNKDNRRGIPLGNLTSQLFSNIYLNELDNFIKRMLVVKSYVRYADDFVLVSDRKSAMECALCDIDKYLNDKLKLNLHPNKVSIQKWIQGIDFLGYVIFPQHIILRTKTKRRILKKMEIKRNELRIGKITENEFQQSRQSYMGILQHCRGSEIKQKM